MKATQRKTNQVTNLNEEQRFDALINAIENRDVLLVIGKGYEVNKDSEENKPQFDELGEDSNLYDLILHQLCQENESDAIDFSELNDDANFSYKEGNIWRHKNLYESISQKIADFELSVDDVNPRLLSLLQTGYFRFVFTTSFSPLVEIAMKEQWGANNVRVLNVMDKDTNNQDILDSQRDLLTPTVYYLFGKAEGTNTFVATDNDALNILQRWQRKTSSYKILEATSNKHLLALGCVQDDWLFRFIWYTLKGQENLSKGSVSRYSKSDSLERYLRRNNILERKDADSFVDRIIQALKDKDANKPLEKPHNGSDVFISYSRRDGDVADAVYKALFNQGLDVWYDKYNLAGRGGDYLKTIFHAIKTCKMFVPILTPTISEQRAERHPYRLEWDCAVNELIKQKGIRCCIPLIDQNYNIYEKSFEDNVPDEIAKQDGFVFNRLSLQFDNWAKEVHDIIQ